MDAPLPVSETHRARLAALLDDARLASGCAAFDADGTLWAGDVGELLLEAMIGLGRAPRHAWERYASLMSKDAPAACAYCVELLRGCALEEIERWSDELVRARLHAPLYRPVIELALELEKRGCEVWVVSGSNAWTVRRAAHDVGIDTRRVLALACSAHDGRLTGEVQRPLTCASGKVDALRAATSRPLLLAAGNALYDLDLLEAAELPLVVAPAGRQTPLREVARARDWVVVDVSP